MVLIFYCFVVIKSPGGPRTILIETNGKQSGTSVKSSSVMFQVRFKIKKLHQTCKKTLV